jgi:N-acyl-D-amino-acid deacylase
MKPILVLALAFCGVCGIAQGTAAENPKTPDAIPETGHAQPETAPLDELMRSFVKEHETPGAALAVARRGKLVYARGFGFADVEHGTLVQPDSLFRIASISKPITAMAILRLVDLGKLKTSDPVLKLVKFKPADGAAGPADARWHGVTVLHLLQHTAGFDRAKSGDPMFRSVDIATELGQKPPARPEAIIRHMLSRRLDFDPGTRYAYSNFGYCVLGRVIESVAGMPYEKYVRDEILKPIGVTRMRIGATREDQRAAGEVRYYTRDKRRGGSVFAADLGSSVPVQYGHWYLEAMDAHGGWIASAVDLVRLASSLDDDAQKRLLSPGALGVMFTPPAAPVARDGNGNLAPTYYACGWQVRPVGGTGKINAWHAGGLDGTSTLLVRRHDGFTWAVLFNTDQTKDLRAPAAAIDGLIHKAVDQVRRWP